MPNENQNIIDLSKAVDNSLLVERLFTVRADELQERDDRTIEVVFSTEYEYKQWFGREVLSHEKSAIDLSRMQNKTAPVLLNHSRSQQIGVVENARILNRQGIATLRFSRNPQADEVYKDILDGIRSQISSGYKIKRWEVDKTDPADVLYTITEWQPYEVSVVTVNADPTALVKRAGYFCIDDVSDDTSKPAGEPTTTNNPADAAERDYIMEKEKEQQTTETPEPTEAQRDVYVAGFEIYERGKAENEQALAMEIIGKRGNLEDFEQALREKREAIAKDTKETAPDAEREDAINNRFNISDLIFQQLNPGAERGKHELEEARDLTSDAEKRGYVSNGGVVIPHSRLDGVGEAKRDLTTAAASGGHLIGDDVRGDIFVEALRNHMVTGDLVDMVTDLHGNASIPAETTAPTAEWKGENAAPTESNPVISQISLTPNFVRGFTEISRTLIAQSSVDVERVIRNSLMKGVGLVVDKAILEGTGADNQPSGVNAITDLATVEYGAAADDLATALGKASVSELAQVEQKLDDANAPDMNRAWIVAPNIRAHFRNKPIGTGGIPSWYMGRLLDTQGYVTNQVTTGNAYYGSWKEVILALWDSIEILVNPFSGDTTGLVRITAWQHADVGIKHNASFAKLTKKS